MNKTRTLIFGSSVAAAMLFGGVIGATVLAKSSNVAANGVLAAASPTPAPRSNEATTHETGETAAQETAENNGTARPAGGGPKGPSNETAAHEAAESAAHEAAEAPGSTTTTPPTN
jgi:hypothetical protein